MLLNHKNISFVFLIPVIFSVTSCKKPSKRLDNASNHTYNIEGNWVSPCYTADSFKLFLTAQKTYLKFSNGTFERTDIEYTDLECKDKMFSKILTGEFSTAPTSSQSHDLNLSIKDHSFILHDKNYLTVINNRFSKNFDLDQTYSLKDISPNSESTPTGTTLFTSFYINSLQTLALGQPTTQASKRASNPAYETFITQTTN